MASLPLRTLLIGALLGCSETGPSALSSSPPASSASGSAGSSSAEASGGSAGATRFAIPDGGVPTPQGGISGDGAAGDTSAAGAVGGDVEPRHKFEPPAGRTLLFIGQHIAAADEYVTDSGDTPAGFMTYSSLSVLEAFQPGHFMNYHHYPSKYPGTAMQLALYLRDSSPSSDTTLQAILAGDYDEELDSLAGELAKEHIPIFLRVEYEVNNNFPATHYPAVFRYVRHYLSEKRGLDNIAYVWHVTTNGTVSGEHNHFDWYPGDDVVDWIAVSFFEEAAGYLATGPIDEAIYEGIYQANLAMISDYAQDHAIPLMVAEASPQKHFLPAGGQAAWDGWYQKLFDYVAEYDVKALCYINENWPDYGWQQEYFGDSRVQKYEPVGSLWKSAVHSPRWVYGGDEFYSLVGFEP